MRCVEYHRNARRYLRKMPVDRKEKIKAVIAEIALLEDPLSHRNVSQLGGEWAGCYRARIGGYRVIFHIVDGEIIDILEVLQVGARGDVYK